MKKCSCGCWIYGAMKRELIIVAILGLGLFGILAIQVFR